MRKSFFLFIIFFVFALVLLQVVGLLQELLDWTVTITHLANSVFVVVGGLILGYIASRVVEDATIRKIIHYLIFAGASITIFSYSKRTWLQLAFLWALLQLPSP